VSIGRRLIDLARAELNSLLERAAHSEDEDGSGGSDGRDSVRYGGADVLSDQELEAELERRKQAREEAEAAARGQRPASGGGAGSARRPNGAAPRRSDDAATRQAYANLEIPPGSDFEAVRKAYRTLMRKYHPDLHNDRPENQKAANELTQKLTDSYKLLEKKLRR
jgi:DnaJ-domain-containing protein 1